MHVYYFLVTVGLILGLILTLEWMLRIEAKQHTYAPRRTTYQPLLFDQDMYKGDDE